MKKLAKKNVAEKETLEAYIIAQKRCGCVCYCGGQGDCYESGYAGGRRDASGA